MTTRRKLVAVGVILAVGILFAWQRHREDRIARCHAADGVWNGPTSSCTTLGGRPLLLRDGLGRI
jgi:hypothetical protein